MSRALSTSSLRLSLDRIPRDVSGQRLLILGNHPDRIPQVPALSPIDGWIGCRDQCLKDGEPNLLLGRSYRLEQQKQRLGPASEIRDMCGNQKEAGQQGDDFDHCIALDQRPYRPCSGTNGLIGIIAAAASATYIAPYLGKLQDAGRDAMTDITAMHEILVASGSQTKVLLASIRDVPSMVALARHGVGHFTMGPAVAEQFFAEVPFE